MAITAIVPATQCNELLERQRKRRRIILTAVVNLLSGLYVGYSIGFPAVYMAYDQLSTDCHTFSTSGACVANAAAHCVWSSVGGGGPDGCHFEDMVNCTIFTTEALCSDYSASCSYDNSACKHLHGWTATQQGLFACSMIIGGTVGSFPVGHVMDRIGRPRSFVLLGVVSLVSCGLMHVACAIKNYAFLVIANILTGMPVGAIQVLAPMYVGEMAPPAHALHVGILIQVGITFGIFVMGVYGFAVQPSHASMAVGAANYQDYFQATIAGLTFLSAMVGVIGLVVPESTHHLQNNNAAKDGGGRLLKDGDDEDSVEKSGGVQHHQRNASASSIECTTPPQRRSQGTHPLETAGLLSSGPPPSTSVVEPNNNVLAACADAHDGGGATTSVPTPFAAYANLPFDRHATTCFGWRKTHVLCFVVSTALSACLSLTGINSFIVYAPVIMQSAGMSSLVGNLVVDGWNFITTLVSLPLAFRCNTTQMFNAGAVLVTVTCVLSGILLFPGVITDDDVRNWVLGAAVLLFIAAFEIGMATAYYVIAQATFPSDARSIGTGYTIAIQYLFNVFINFMYPVGLDAFSPTGGSNQRGMAVWLMIYGSIGVLTTCMLIKYLGYAQYIASTM